MAILTFDLGTTYYKLCLFDDEGKLRHLCRVAPPITHPKPGWWEITAKDYLATITNGLEQLRAAAGSLEDVRAISYATQANSFTLLDENDEALSPIILWLDERAKGLESPLASLALRDDFYLTTGLVEVGHQFSHTKLDWLRREQPEAFAKAQRLCFISDLLALWMTGEHVTDCTMAALSGLVNIRTGDWWPEALEVCDLPRDLLPRVQYPGTPIGTLLPNIAERFGFSKDCRFITGCLDQYAGAIGAANVRPGGISETTGTVLATVCCTDQLASQASGEVYQGPAFEPGLYYQMCFNMTSAQILEDYRNAQPDHPEFDELGREAAAAPIGCDGLRFANHQHKQVEFDRRTDKHTRGHETRAILEAVAFALKDQVGALRGDALPPVIASLGGAARSDIWLQIKADVLGTVFRAPACEEPTSLGAAILAASALSGDSVAEIAERFAAVRRDFEPDTDAQSAYAKLSRA